MFTEVLTLSTSSSPPSAMSATSSPQQEILQIIDQWTDAFTAKDVDGLMRLYVDDARIFDAIPPHESSTAAEYREIWEMCLPYFPDKFDLTVHDRRVDVSGDLAITHCLYRINGLEHDGPSSRTFLRNTTCLRRQADGAWKIVHEHTSVPFDPYTDAAAFIFDPTVKAVAQPCNN